MLTININPVLFKIGSLEIRYYGLVYVLGILLVYFYLKKKKIGSDKKLERFMFFLVFGMFLGARLFGLWSQGVFNPLEFFKIWKGGMSFFGGFLGGLIGSWYVLRKKILEVGDLVVIPVSFVLILGRLANFINQELVGTVTNVKWCVNFVNYMGCRHPYQLYSAFGHLVLFGFLYFKNKRDYKRGEIFFSFILGYGILRFVLDFFRENYRIFGLTGWQYFSILFIVVAVIFLLKQRDNKKNKYQ